MNNDTIDPQVNIRALPVPKDVKGTKEDVDRLYFLMAAVIIVLLVGFATMFIAVFGIFRDNEAQSQATFQNLTNQVQAQNNKIDILTQAIKSNQLAP